MAQIMTKMPEQKRAARMSFCEVGIRATMMRGMGTHITARSVLESISDESECG